MTDYVAVMASGQVMRYHANITMNRMCQTNADHSWGVVSLILMLHPNPSLNLIRAAQFHDCGEIFVGDLPAPFKRAHPELAASHRAVEHQILERMGIPVPNLTMQEQDWLDFADRLESRLYMDAECLEDLRPQAIALGIEEQFQEIVES